MPALTGCSATAPKGTSYTLHRAVSPCARPAPLALPLLDSGKHIAHPVNLALLTLGVDHITEQLADMNAALVCFEMQAESDRTQ